MPPTNSNPSAIPGQPQATPAPAQPAWWEKILPTAGGLAGSVIGGILGGGTGATAGAAIPGADLTGAPEVAGGVMGAKIGSTAGAGIGGSLGQGAEDFLMNLLHQQGAPKTVASALPGVAASGAENAIGNGIGEGINWLGGKAIGGVAGALEKAQAGRAAQATDAVNNVPWEGIAGSAAAKNAELEPTLSKMTSYGLGTSPKELAAVTPQITGKDGAVLSDLVRGGMAKSTNPVDITGTVGLANNYAASPELASEGPTVGKAFMNTVNNYLGLNKGGTLTKNTAGDIYEARQALMDKAFTTPNEALGNAYHAVARSLDGALTKSGVDNVVGETGITPEQFKTLHDISPQLANEATTASQQGVGALRTLQKPFVNAANLVKAQSYHAGGQLPGAIDAKVAKAAGGSNSGMLDAIGLAGLPFTHGASGALLLPHALQVAKSPVAQDATLAGIKKVTGSAAAKKAIGGLVRSGAIIGANAPNMGASPIPSATNATNAGGNVQQQLSPLEQYILNQQQNIQGQQAAQDALMTQEENAPLDLSGLAGAAASMGGNAASMSNALGSIIPQAQQQAALAAPVEQALGAYQHAGGAQGFLGGGESMLNSLIPGTAANAYQGDQQAAANALAAYLKISPEAAMRMLPGLMQSPGTAARQTGALQGIGGELGGSAIPVASGQ